MPKTLAVFLSHVAAQVTATVGMSACLEFREIPVIPANRSAEDTLRFASCPPGGFTDAVSGVPVLPAIAFDSPDDLRQLIGQSLKFGSHLAGTGILVTNLRQIAVAARTANGATMIVHDQTVDVPIAHHDFERGILSPGQSTAVEVMAGLVTAATTRQHTVWRPRVLAELLAPHCEAIAGVVQAATPEVRSRLSHLADSVKAPGHLYARDDLAEIHNRATESIHNANDPLSWTVAREMVDVLTRIWLACDEPDNFTPTGTVSVSRPESVPPATWFIQAVTAGDLCPEITTHLEAMATVLRFTNRTKLVLALTGGGYLQTDPAGRTADIVLAT